MKFAEMTQEVQIARPTPMKLDYGMTPGRRKANQIFKMAVSNMVENGTIEAKKLDVDIGLVYSLGPKFPEYNTDAEQAGELIAQLIQHLDQRIQKRITLVEDYNARRKFNLYYCFIHWINTIIFRLGDKFRMQLVQMGTELATANSMVNLERQKVAIKDKKIEAFEARIESHETKIEELTRKLRERENQLKETKNELNQMKYMLSQKDLDQEKQKKKFDTKRAVDHEKISREYENKLRAEKDRIHVSKR